MCTALLVAAVSFHGNRTNEGAVPHRIICAHCNRESANKIVYTNPGCGRKIAGPIQLFAHARKIPMDSGRGGSRSQHGSPNSISKAKLYVLSLSRKRSSCSLRLLAAPSSPEINLLTLIVGALLKPRHYTS